MRVKDTPCQICGKLPPVELSNYMELDAELTLHKDSVWRHSDCANPNILPMWVAISVSVCGSDILNDLRLERTELLREIALEENPEKSKTLEQKLNTIQDKIHKTILSQDHSILLRK